MIRGGMIRVTSRCCMPVLGSVAVSAILIYLISTFLMPWKADVIKDLTGPRAVDSLKLIVVVSRSGNHGAESDYPGDPYPNNNTEFWPYPPNELTPRGRVQMYNLGVKVRSLYLGFIPITLYPKDLHASSTYLDRLLMSGEAFLAGLYPPRGFQVWDEGFDWQPTALYSDSPDRSWDLISKDCPEFRQEFMRCLKLVLEKYASNITELGDYLTNVTGANFTERPEKMVHLQQKAFSEKFEDYTLPDWLEAIYDNLRDLISEFYLAKFAGSRRITRLIAGELMEQVLNAMIQKVNGSLTPDRKIIYYSGHGTLIMALQRIRGTP